MKQADVLVTVVLLLLLTAPTRAVGVGDGNEDRLPGSRMSLREAIQSSQTIVIARDVEMGKPEMRVSSGKRSYGGIKLKVVKSLKGKAPDVIFPVRATLITYPPTAVETLPINGNEYIVFIKGVAPEVSQAIKVLRATEENRRATLGILQEGQKVAGFLEPGHQAALLIVLDKDLALLATLLRKCSTHWPPSCRRSWPVILATAPMQAVV
jgi:hypothetical protein